MSFNLSGLEHPNVFKWNYMEHSVKYFIVLNVYLITQRLASWMEMYMLTKFSLTVGVWRVRVVTVVCDKLTINVRDCFHVSYLVNGTCSLWSTETDGDLLRKAGENIRNVSSLLVDEHVMSAFVCVLWAVPFDWQARHEHELPPGPRTWPALAYSDGCRNAQSSSGRGYGWERSLKVSSERKGLANAGAEAPVPDPPAMPPKGE